MTELQNAAKAAATRPRIQPAEEGDDRPLSVSARLGRLQFHQSGKFRVLQLADIQDGPKVSKDTVKLIEASLDATRPDIVIFTGNQIAGYDPAYAQTTRKRRWSAAAGISSKTASSKSSEASERFEAALERTCASVRATVEQLVRPLADRGIPWAVTFGNHDFQCGLSNAEIESICREFPGCVNPEPTGGESGPRGRKFCKFCGKHGFCGRCRFRATPGGIVFAESARIRLRVPGTFALPVADVDHTMFRAGLWYCWIRVDYARSGGYGSPSAAALQFLAEYAESECVRNRRKLGDRRNRRSRAWYSSIFRCNSITNCLSRPRRMRRVRLKATAISLENITFWMRKKRFPAVIWGRVSAARMPTAVNSRYWNSMTILRFPRDMITATHSLEQCRFREKWPRLMRRRRLRQARLAV